MRNLLKTINYAVLLLVISSCGKEELEVKKVDLVDAISSYNDAKEKLGVYADFLFFTKSAISIVCNTATMEDPPGSGRVAQKSRFSLSKYIRVPNSEFSGTEGIVDGGTIYVNDLKFDYDVNKKLYTPTGDDLRDDPASQEDIRELYGREVEFSIVDKNKNKAFSKTIYAPEIIMPNPLNFEVIEGYQNRVLTGDLELSWNADPKNKNGIALYVIWDGQMNSTNPWEPSSQSNKSERFGVFIPEDDGHCIIPAKYFKKIPSKAIFIVNVYRGIASKEDFLLDGLQNVIAIESKSEKQLWFSKK